MNLKDQWWMNRIPALTKFVWPCLDVYLRLHEHSTTVLSMWSTLQEVGGSPNILYIQKRNIYNSLLTNLSKRDIWMEEKFSPLGTYCTHQSCFVNRCKYWKRSINGDSYICTYRPYCSFAQLGPTAGKWGASQDQGPHLSASCLGCLRPGRESRRVYPSNATSMKCFYTESFAILLFYLTQSPLVVGIQRFE